MRGQEDLSEATTCCAWGPTDAFFGSCSRKAGHTGPHYDGTHEWAWQEMDQPGTTLESVEQIVNLGMVVNSAMLLTKAERVMLIELLRAS